MHRLISTSLYCRRGVVIDLKGEISDDRDDSGNQGKIGMYCTHGEGRGWMAHSQLAIAELFSDIFLTKYTVYMYHVML